MKETIAYLHSSAHKLDQALEELHQASLSLITVRKLLVRDDNGPDGVHFTADITEEVRAAVLE